MENENKEFHGSVEETELQKKVRQDVAEKIAEAAAEVQDEIDSASALAKEEEARVDEVVEDAEILEEGGEWEEEAVVVKEPKKVTMNLSSLILSLVGTAIIGALLLLGGMQIPKWMDAMPEGSTVATVDGTKITNLDMEYYLYVAAMQYFEENTEGLATDPTAYDWEQEVEDGKTAEDIVRENAIDIAIGETLLLNACDTYGAEFDAEEARNTAKMQNEQMISTYGEELVMLNAKRQGIASLKQYARKVEQAMKLQAVQGDMEENPDKYYPEDKAVLEDYLQEDTATFTHILIAKEKLEDEAEQAASNEEKRAKAEEILARIQNGEDFDALLAEVGEDTNQTAEGYSFEKGSTGMDEVEEATLKLKADEISEVVESEQGYHIIKQMVGLVELEDYWKAQAKIKVKEGKIKKMSLQEILDNIKAATEDFEKLYEETQKTAE